MTLVHPDGREAEAPNATMFRAMVLDGWIATTSTGKAAAALVLAEAERDRKRGKAVGDRSHAATSAPSA